jgi:hypothetical protein
MILITRRVCIHVKLSELKGGILKRGERDKSKHETKPPPATSLRNRIPHSHPASLPP